LKHGTLDTNRARSRELHAPGNTLAESAIDNPYMFNGRRYDPESGFYWYRTRYLDPLAGRFTTRDTIGVWGA